MSEETTGAASIAAIVAIILMLGIASFVAWRTGVFVMGRMR